MRELCFGIHDSDRPWQYGIVQFTAVWGHAARVHKGNSKSDRSDTCILRQASDRLLKDRSLALEGAVAGGWSTAAAGAYADLRRRGVSGGIGISYPGV